MMAKVLIDVLSRDDTQVKLLDKRFSRTVSEIGKFSLRKLASSVWLVFRLINDLVWFRPRQVVFFCTNRPTSFLVDWVLSEVLRAARIDVINYIHTLGYKALASRGRPWHFLVSRLLSQAKRTVCLSPTLESDVREWILPESVVSIPNTVYGQATTERRSGADQRDTLSILYLSNLIPEKGADTFIDLAVAILRTRPNLTFELVGADSSRNISFSLRKRIERSGFANQIHLRGATLNDQEKWSYLTKADVLVFPSRYEFEAQPLTILEALSVGTPVIAFGIGGIPDQIINGVTGYVVTPSDGESIYRKTLHLIDSPHTRVLMGKQARLDYESRFSEAAFAKSWAELLSLPVLAAG